MLQGVTNEIGGTRRFGSVVSITGTRANVGFWRIASILGLSERDAIGGSPDHPAKSNAAPAKRSAKSYGVAALPIGTRRGLPHHSATTKR
jgi:hypothetical protein